MIEQMMKKRDWQSSVLHGIADRLIEVDEEYRRLRREIAALREADAQKEIRRLRDEVESIGDELGKARQLIMEQGIELSRLRHKLETATGLKQT